MKTDSYADLEVDRSVRLGAWESYRKWLLSESDCVDAKPIRGGVMYAAIKPLLFHWTMIIGVIGDVYGYEDRWCYANERLAAEALRDWDGQGEPTGWHRHPLSGRRRPAGNPALEYIAP